MRKRNFEQMRKNGIEIQKKRPAAAFDAGDFMAMYDYLKEQADSTFGLCWKTFDIAVALGYHLAQLEAKNKAQKRTS